MSQLDTPTAQPPRQLSQRHSQLEQRCQRFIEVAEELFLERGFAGTTVNEVVRIAGGSLATLYAEFGNKDELFEAVMKKRAGRLLDGLREELGKGSLREELVALASRTLKHVLSNESLSVYRLAVHEGPKSPAVRNVVMQNGWDAYLSRLAKQFESLSGSGLNVDDSRIAAELFLSMVLGQLRTLAAWGHGESISPERQAAHVQRTVDQFLRIYPPAI